MLDTHTGETNSRRIAPDDPRLSWHGTVSVQRTDDYAMPWRLPHDRLALFPPEDLQDRAAMPAGVRLAVWSDTTAVTGEVAPVAESAPLDLCCDGTLVGSFDLAGKSGFRFAGLPPGRKLIELWLPQFGTFRLHALAISAGARIEPFEDVRPRWITYGSSITQCRAAASPTQTWPAIVARQHGLNLTCLGYGGQCHLDQMIARLIRDLPAEYLSMCVGINIYGAASLSARTLGPAIIAFVQTIRERHPETPFAVLSPIYSPPREETRNAVGLTLRDVRAEVAAAVDALRAAGDRHVSYIDGMTIFGPEHAHLLPDELHPDAEGYRVMGERFLRLVAARLFV